VTRVIPGQCAALNPDSRDSASDSPLIEARRASLIAISSQKIEENKNVGFDCHAARGMPRDGITPRGERQ
jgi:hypothetical protein